MKQLIGFDTTNTPNDAFSRITLGNKRYGINLYVKFQNDTPISGVTVTSSGQPPISGSMVTDENGTGVTPTVTGCAGGWCVLNSVANNNELVVISGAGANGIAIFKWTT